MGIAARRRILQFAIATAIDFLIVVVYFKLLHVNQTTVGFTFLLAILAVSASWGLACAIYMSMVATLAYNYFFLPPIFRFTIADPQNWIALFTFLVTAVLASQLSERARRQALEANQRRHEVERLYAFSQQLLVTENVRELINMIPRYIVESFRTSGCALFLEGKHDAYYSDLAAQSSLPAEQLKTVAGRGEPILEPEHSALLHALAYGSALRGSARADRKHSLAGNPGSRRQLDRHCHRAGSHHGEAEQSRGRARKRPAALRAAGCGDPRVPHAL